MTEKYSGIERESAQFDRGKVLRHYENTLLPIARKALEEIRQLPGAEVVDPVEQLLTWMHNKLVKGVSREAAKWIEWSGDDKYFLINIRTRPVDQEAEDFLKSEGFNWHGIDDNYFVKNMPEVKRKEILKWFKDKGYLSHQQWSGEPKTSASGIDQAEAERVIGKFGRTKIFVKEDKYRDVHGKEYDALRVVAVVDPGARFTKQRFEVHVYKDENNDYVVVDANEDQGHGDLKEALVDVKGRIKDFRDYALTPL